ncbi:hypothetical protein A1F94_009244 [Pyrenophora tritici-repentis]|nr:hypothetical protein A1F94_009244 [Pyrenophora tritici-repentis]
MLSPPLLSPLIPPRTPPTTDPLALPILSSTLYRPPTESIFSYDWSSIPKDFVDEVLEYFIALQVENSTSVNPGPQKRATLPKHGCDHINEWIRREYKPDISVQAYEDECKPAGSNDYQAPGHCPPRTYCTEVETVEANQIVIDTRCVPHKQPKKDNWNGVAQYEYRHVHAYYEETKFQDVPIVLNQAISGASVSAHVESSLKEWAIKTDATLTGNNKDHAIPDYINCLPINMHNFVKGDIVDFTFGLLLHQVGIFLYYIGK